MHFLTILRRIPVADESGRRARLLDLSVDPLGTDHPPVTRLLLKTEAHARAVLPAEAIREVDGRIVVADLGAAEPAPESDDDGGDDVWLGRDVLDSLVLDLDRRRATRANDLALAVEDGRFALVAADVSTRAILRRLTGGRVARDASKCDLFDWAYVEFFRGDPAAARAGAGEHLRINRLQPGEIAALSGSLPYPHAAELLTLLPDPLAADALEEMLPQRQLQVFEELDEEQADRLLALMAPDVAADLVGRLVPKAAKARLERLPAERRDRIVALLRYPEDSVGGMMTDDFLVACEGWTVGETRERLRDAFREPDFIYFVYVVADEASRKLVGVVTLRELLVEDEDAVLGEIANRFLVTLQPLEPARVAAFRLLDSQINALPVVSSDLRIVGVMTVDAAVGLVAPADWRQNATRVFS